MQESILILVHDTPLGSYLGVLIMGTRLATEGSVDEQTPTSLSGVGRRSKRKDHRTRSTGESTSPA